MAVSTNLKYRRNRHLMKRFTSGKQTLGITDAGNATGLKSNRGVMGLLKKFCYKAGIPGSDIPNGAFDICEDITNGHWYINTTYDAAVAGNNVWTLIA